MGYVILEGTEDQAQETLSAVLKRENAVKMIIVGEDKVDIYERAKKVAEEEPEWRWVVWGKKPGLLTAYTRPGKVLCTLSRTNKLVSCLDREHAELEGQIRQEFLKAQL